MVSGATRAGKLHFGDELFTVRRPSSEDCARTEEYDAQPLNNPRMVRHRDLTWETPRALFQFPHVTQASSRRHGHWYELGQAAHRRGRGPRSATALRGEQTDKAWPGLLHHAPIATRTRRADGRRHRAVCANGARLEGEIHSSDRH